MWHSYLSGMNEVLRTQPVRTLGNNTVTYENPLNFFMNPLCVGFWVLPLLLLIAMACIVFLVELYMQSVLTLQALDSKSDVGSPYQWTLVLYLYINSKGRLKTRRPFLDLQWQAQFICQQDSTNGECPKNMKES